MPIVKLEEALFIRMLLHGDSGAGKTRLAASAAACAEMQPVIFFDFEEGIMGAREFANMPITFVAATGQADIILLQKALLQQTKPKYKTVVVDPLTEMYALMMDSQLSAAGRTSDMPQLQDYGAITTRMRKFFRLARQSPCHFIATCGTQPNKDETSGSIYMTPDLPGKLANQAPRFFDVVGYLAVHVRRPRGQAEATEVQRSLQVQPYGRIIAKDRSNSLGHVVANPDMSGLFETIFRKEKQPNA